LNVGTTGLVGATWQVAPTPNQSKTLIPNSLGAIIGQFKTASAKRINALRGSGGIPVWQRNYHEHVIRNECELESIWKYIEVNPANWETDQENQ